MLLAEVHAGSPAAQVVRTGEFHYPDGKSLKDAEALGRALAEFLREKDFDVRTVVFGLPAKWVLSKHKELPIADERLLADTLRLQAQAEFSPELSDLVYDYSGSPGNAGSQSVLLMAVSNKYINQLSKIAEEAKLKVVALMPYSAALVQATAQPSRSLQTLLLGPSGVEFASEQGGAPQMLRYVGASADASPLIVGELRRASAQAPQNGATVNGASREMILWNDTGADDASFRSIGDALNVSLRQGKPRDLGVEAAKNAADGRDYAAPIALALAGLSPRVPVDFLHSRLEPPPEKKIDRRLVLVIAAAVAIVLGTAFWAWSLYSEQAAIKTAQEQLDSNKKVREARQKEVARIEFARGWHAEEPRFISCLRDLTEAAPETGELYGTALNLKDDMSGTFSGKARSEQTVLDLQERLQRKHFTNVATPSMESHNDPKTGREVTFTIVFNYVPAGAGTGAAQWSSPSVKKVSR